MANKTAPKPAAEPVEATQDQKVKEAPVEDKPAETVEETETPPEETEAEADAVAEPESTTDDDVTEVNGKSDTESLKRKDSTVESEDSPKKKKIEEVQEEKPVEVVA